MNRLRIALWILCSAAALVALGATLGRAQNEPYQFERDIEARRRVFAASVNAGVHAIRTGPAGNTYVLADPAHAVMIYDGSGKKVGQVPSESAAGSQDAALMYGDAFDVDAAGRVAVVDRGASRIKLYGPDGALLAAFAVSGPASVALLPTNEIAVATQDADRLVSVYDFTGKFVRDYGDREELADDPAANREINFGEIVADPAGNTYFAFDYLPEPTVHKFDRAGYLSLEIALKTIEFQPAAQAARRAIARSDNGPISLHRILNGIAIDPQNQGIWLADGDLLMQFDKDGTRLASFRTYMPGGVRMDGTTITIQPDRMLIGVDPYGVFEFRRPDQAKP